MVPSELLRLDITCYVCMFLLPLIIPFSWLSFSPVSACFKLNTWLMDHGLAVTLGYIWYSSPKKVVTMFLPQTILFRKSVQIIGGLTPNAWLFVAANIINFAFMLWSYEIIPQLFPKSFTFCELVVVTQAVTSVLSQSLICQFLEIVDGPSDGFCSTDNASLVLQHLLVGFTFLLMTFLCLPNLRQTVVSCYTIIIFWWCCTYLSIWNSLNAEPITWLIDFLTLSTSRTSLVLTWMVLVASTIVYGMVVSTSSTVKRKFYHVIVVLVFATGLKHDARFLSFASGCILYVLSFLELIRLLRLPPLYKPIDGIYAVFRDERDAGPLTLTHIYLLLGCALPIWLNPSIDENNVLMSSGIITIGFGDTASSFFGKKLGKHFWPGSRKSLEGTIAFVVVSLLGTILLCNYFSINYNSVQWTAISLAIIVVAVIEANTAQIDNLILPLYFDSLLVGFSWFKII